MWLSSPLLSPPRLVAPIWGFAIKFHIWRLTPTSLSTFPASSSMRIPFQRFDSPKILSSNPSCIKVEVMVGKKLWIELTYEILRQRWTPEVSFVKSQASARQFFINEIKALIQGELPKLLTDKSQRLDFWQRTQLWWLRWEGLGRSDDGGDDDQVGGLIYFQPAANSTMEVFAGVQLFGPFYIFWTESSHL